MRDVRPPVYQRVQRWFAPVEHPLLFETKVHWRALRGREYRDAPPTPALPQTVLDLGAGDLPRPVSVAHRPSNSLVRELVHDGQKWERHKPAMGVYGSVRSGMDGE